MPANRNRNATDQRDARSMGLLLSPQNPSDSPSRITYPGQEFCLRTCPPINQLVQPSFRAPTVRERAACPPVADAPGSDQGLPAQVLAKGSQSNERQAAFRVVPALQVFGRLGEQDFQR